MFECSLDNGEFARCASPHTLSPGAGDHTFAVRAVDTVGNSDQSPATAAFTLVAPPGPGPGPGPTPTPTPTPTPGPGPGPAPEPGPTPDTVAPGLTAITLSPAGFRVGAAATPTIAAVKRGSRLSYTLSEA